MIITIARLREVALSRINFGSYMDILMRRTVAAIAHTLEPTPGHIQEATCP